MTSKTMKLRFRSGPKAMINSANKISKEQVKDGRQQARSLGIRVLSRMWVVATGGLVAGLGPSVKGLGDPEFQTSSSWWRAVPRGTYPTRYLWCSGSAYQRRSRQHLIKPSTVGQRVWTVEFQPPTCHCQPVFCNIIRRYELLIYVRQVSPNSLAPAKSSSKHGFEFNSAPPVRAPTSSVTVDWFS